MNKLNKILLGLTFLFTVNLTHSETISNYLQLSPDKVVPPIVGIPQTSGTGSAIYTDVPTNTITITVTFTNLPSGYEFVKLHGPASPETNGPVIATTVFSIVHPTNGTRTFTYTEGQINPFNVKAFKTGLWYVAVYDSNANYSNGVIRAQLDGTNISNNGGPGGTNNPSQTLLSGITFEKLKPKDGKKLPAFKSSKGFSAKGVIKKSGDSNIVVDAVYVSLLVSGTNGTGVEYGKVKYTPKTASKGQAKKGLLYTFKSGRDGGKVGIGTPNSLSKGTAVGVVFTASNSAGVYSQTNKLTINKVK